MKYVSPFTNAKTTDGVLSGGKKLHLGRLVVQVLIEATLLTV